MNIKEIEELLEKYYDGETTLEEEKVLKNFFVSGDVPLDLSVHKSQFLYFAEASREEISDRELEKKVFAEKVGIPVVPLHSSRKRFYYISGIAATVLLLIGLVFTFNEDVVNKPKGKVSTTDPEVVFTQTRDILAVVSVNLNKGMDKVQYLGKLDQAMQKMQMLSKYYKYQTIIINPDQFEKRSEKNK
jgi:hypothetical protein